MIEEAAEFYRAMLVRWVGGVGRVAWWVALVAIAATVALAAYFVGNLRINTDTGDMISRKLPFRQTADALSRAFPQHSDNILIVVEGATPDLADDAARALAARLGERPQLFGSVYDPAGHPFFRRNGLLFLKTEDLYKLSERLAEAQPFVGALWRDHSLRGLFEMLVLAIDTTLEEREKGKEPPIEIGKVLERIAEVVEAQAASRFANLSWHKLMRGDAADDDSGRRFILIQPALEFETMRPAARAIGAIRELVRELGLDARNGVRVRLTGSAAIAQDELTSVAGNMEWAAAASLVMVIGLLAVGLKSARLVVATLATLIAGLIATGAFAIAALGELNLISIAFAVFSIGLGIDYGIHFALRYREEIDAGADNEASLAAAAAGVGGALTLCTLTSMIGFFSFLPTDYVGLAQLGLIGGVGMLISLFANLTLLPALLTLLPIRPESAKSASRPRPRLQPFISRHPRAICWVALALGAAGAASVAYARFDFDPINLRDRNTESVATLFDLMQEKRTNPYTISVLAESLPRAQALAERLAALPEVDEASTLADYVPKDQREKLDAIADMALFLVPALEARARKAPPSPSERRAALEELIPALVRLDSSERRDVTTRAARRLRAAFQALSRNGAFGDGALAEMERRLVSGLPQRLAQLREALDPVPVGLDGLPKDLSERHVTADGRARVDVSPKENVHERRALTRFVDAVRSVVPDATGSPVVILESGNAVIAAFQTALVISASFTVGLVAVIVRNARDVGLVLAPLALAALTTIGASVALGLSFNFANVIVLPLLFGLTVHFAIHLVLREREQRELTGGDAASAFETTTPRAVVLSALTTIGSFGSISFSSHPGTASMGILLTIALTLALASTLVVLPALMARFPVRGRASEGLR